MDAIDLIAALKTLEYDIRRSITLREDLEDDAEEVHRDAAARCGIDVVPPQAKGDLLSAVQTTLRALEQTSRREESRHG
jgi:hypothetical protein